MLLRLIAALALLALLPGAMAGEASCPQQDPGALEPSPRDRLVVTADSLDGSPESLADLAGSVRLRLGEREITAESLQYDDVERVVVAEVPLRFRNQDYLIQSQSGRYDLRAETGVFEQSDFTLLSRGARGAARELRLARSGTAELNGLSYTTCGPGNDAWRLTAGSLKLDRNRGIGIARNATLRLGPVPVLYTPYLRFPIDGERHSGFLFPTFGNDTRTGVDTRIPYYLNLAPNYDATLTPRYMSERGAQLITAGRYLMQRGMGNINFEYMPTDKRFDDRTRTYTEWWHDMLINNRVSLDVHFTRASDERYLEDLSFTPGLAANPYLESSARVVYQAPSAYTVQLLFQDFQPLAGTLAVDEPYRRLPELRFDGVTRNDALDTRFGLSAKTTNFDKANAVKGTRQVLKPYLNWTRDQGSHYTAVQGDFHYTRYQLRDEADKALDDRQRSLPIVSGEAGLRFHREASDGGLQLLEPKLFYLYAPFRDQNGLPVFDAGQPDYDFPQLFTRNRFVGEDRIADANQLTSALTFRALDGTTGATWLTAAFGQITRFDPSRVTVPGFAAVDAGSTDYLASGEWRVGPKLSTTALLQLDPKAEQLNRSSVGLRYRSGRYRADLDYRYRAGLLEQFDASGTLPMGRTVKAATRVRYSLREERLLDGLLGLEYSTCCYAVQTSFRRFLVNSAGDVDTGVFVQLELKGLSRLGTGFDELLTGEDRPLGSD